MVANFGTLKLLREKVNTRFPEQSAAPYTRLLDDGDREIAFSSGPAANTTATSPRRSHSYCSKYSCISPIKTRTGVMVEEISEDYRKK
jgi:hypothetical protein